MAGALMMDLDGTIIQTRSGAVFPKTTDDWEFKKETIEAIKKWDYNKLFIITNQQGISKGYLTEEEFRQKANAIIKALEKEGIKVNELRFASTKKTAKPKPNMAYSIAQNYHVDLSQSIYVGDRPEDKEFAENAGMEFIHVNQFVKK